MKEVYVIKRSYYLSTETYDGWFSEFWWNHPSVGDAWTESIQPESHWATYNSAVDKIKELPRGKYYSIEKYFV